MNEDQVRRIVQQEIQKNASNKRFDFNQMPRHIHNGQDSPYTFQPILTYIGDIDDNTPPDVNALPKGWKIEQGSGGLGFYTVTHNLSTNTGSGANSNRFGALYTVAAQQVAGGTPLTSIVDTFPNTFTVIWQDSVGTFTNTSFMFILTVINNRNSQIPTYYGAIT